MARPLWNTPLVPLQLLVTAVAGAIGLVLVLERAMGIVRVADTRLLNQALAAKLRSGLGQAQPKDHEDRQVREARRRVGTCLRL